MSLFKRGSVWWYEFVFESKRYRESTKQGNKRVAEQIEAAKRTQLAKREVGIDERKPVPTLDSSLRGLRIRLRCSAARNRAPWSSTNPN